jgi:hypothetical protein
MSKIQVGDLWRGKEGIQDRNPFISPDDIVLITYIVKIDSKDFFEYTHTHVFFHHIDDPSEDFEWELQSFLADYEKIS